jgi:hypothetical protein
MPKAKQVRARFSFGTFLDGKERIIKQGTLLPASQPVVKGREELFEPHPEEPSNK